MRHLKLNQFLFHTHNGIIKILKTYACAFWRDARSARKSSRAMTPGDGGGGGGGELGARCMDRALRSSCARASAESLQALGIQTTIAAKG